MIILKTFDNSIEAHLLKSKLESENIECFIIDENMVTLNPLYSNAVGGIKLSIESADLQKAQIIINEIETQKNNSEIINLKCPNCDATDFYDFKSFRGFKGILSLILTVSFLVYPIFFKRVYKCKNCGKEIEIPNR